MRLLVFLSIKTLSVLLDEFSLNCFPRFSYTHFEIYYFLQFWTCRVVVRPYENVENVFKKWSFWKIKVERYSIIMHTDGFCFLKKYMMYFLEKRTDFEKKCNNVFQTFEEASSGFLTADVENGSVTWWEN